MRLELYTWDSHAINDVTNYQAVIQPGNAMPSATATFIDLGRGNPILAGKILDGGYFTFKIILRGNIETQRDELNKWFRPNDFTLRKLVALDKDNGDKDWYLEGYPVTPPLAGEKISEYSITLALSSPYWIENDLNTNTWSITADTETEVMTNVGNVAALPKITLTAINAKGSNLIGYKTFYAIHTSGYGGTFPIDITAASLDTDAMITAGNLLASGDDLSVIINGAPAYRWFGGGGIDSATTGVWTHMTFTPAPVMTLATTLDNSTTPATITANYTSNYAIMIKPYSTIQIGSELITFSSYGYNPSLKMITFDVLQRGAKGSTKAAHAIGDAVYWIENEVWLSYGNPDATPPVIDDNQKPTFNLTTSTNTNWDYSIFGTSGLAQTAAPYQSGSGIYYNTTRMSKTGTLYEVIGIRIDSSVKAGGVISADKPHWIFSHPGGFSHIDADGETFRSGSLFGTCTIDANGITYYTVPITIPALPNVWEGFTVDEDLAENPTQLRFSHTGALGTTLPSPYALAELDNVSLTIYNPPTITPIGIEQVNYNFNGTIKNNATGDIINLNNLLTKTGETITIDCETKEIYSTDGQRLRAFISLSGTVRDEWFTLESGANSIVFTDVGTAQVTQVTTWRGRNTI